MTVIAATTITSVKTVPSESESVSTLVDSPLIVLDSDVICVLSSLVVPLRSPMACPTNSCTGCAISSAAGGAGGGSSGAVTVKVVAPDPVLSSRVALIDTTNVPIEAGTSAMLTLATKIPVANLVGRASLDAPVGSTT